MVPKKIETLIVKYFTNQINDEETKKLNDWLIDKNNKIIFQEYVALNFSIEQLKHRKNHSKSLVWNAIEHNIKDKRKRHAYWKYAVAATITILITIPLFVKNKSESSQQPIIVNNAIKEGTDKATLTLEDGSNITLEKGQNYVTNSAKSNGTKIIYNDAKSNITEITYNSLTVPRGGQYNVELSDGTQVWLNSESKLKYPVNFIDGETRHVELVYGEAYFEVSPSTYHNGDNFMVLNNFQEIEVLGTKFNIRAYSDEDNIITTLVEGKVKVSTDINSKILKPNEQSVIHSKTKTILVAEANIKQEIAWVNGDFVFNKLPLKTIMKTIERWYDVNVVFENESLENERFIGELSKYQSLEEILKLIKQTTIINNYEIKDKTVIIN
ncbi:DUF4974 domain-containing protein [Flavivirga amylovorans]|uniref:DUF4974 domain-containing protein n=1 Tax=Flavivirga amylovorans TaxID=870486 RepID=A0ABT8X0Z4_9FLAO|nr:FecR family protein [Flavivirga amylovorans]MDO5987615.1 DUF4974 domain-containing protein [Flavivirga amylovorans]